MQRFSIRQPLTFAFFVAATFTLGLFAWTFVLPNRATSITIKPGILLGIDATRIIIPAVFLTAIGAWRIAGFDKLPARAALVPFLPLLLIPLFPIVFGPGFTVSDPGKIVLLVVTNLAVGFGEEATFRGVVLRTLAPRGLMRAAVVSSILFGCMHLVNLATGNSVGNVGFQVAYTALIGFLFAAVALVTGAIWPLIFIHFAMDLANALQTTASSGSGSGGVDIASGLMNVALFALFALYGYWLLRRHLGEMPPVEQRISRRESATVSGD